ncbi:unnamed protein product, partial [Natator depressus]
DPQGAAFLFPCPDPLGAAIFPPPPLLTQGMRRATMSGVCSLPAHLVIPPPHVLREELQEFLQDVRGSRNSLLSSDGGTFIRSSGPETHTDLFVRLEWRPWSPPTYSPRCWGLPRLCRLLHLQVRMEGLVVNLINIYALASGPERLRFYQQASAFLGTLDPHECLVLGGDFNTTLEERDCSGTEHCPAAADVLREIVEHHSLVDVWRDHHPDNISTFTFVRVEAHQLRHSRLDRIYLSRFHLSRAHSSSIRPAPFSDHHIATVMASLCAERPGPAYWHFSNSLLEDVGFVTSFWEFWLAWRGQRHAFPSARRWWDLGKAHARLFCRDNTRGASRRRHGAIKQLEQEVLELERHLAASPEDPPLCGTGWEKREELRALKGHWARGAFVRSRIRLLQEMDRGSRFFYALEKKRGAKKHVTYLLAEDGAPLTDPAEMCGRARAFYAGLFSPDPTDPNACRVLWDELPTVSAGDRDRLELPLTLAKFSEALRRMPTNKSPGMDGLTVEFYRVFWGILSPDLVTLSAESLQSGVLPLSCRRAVLALLLKKGDLRDLRNWRPVSLLSTDYKFVAKAISLWLGSVLADVIQPDQTYTVLGRTIFDNLYLVRDLLELGCRDGLSFALLSLDQEKAFDRMDHGRLMGLALREPELRLVLSAYADDVLLVVQDPGDLARVEACQAVYSAASSVRVNWVKSSGLVALQRLLYGAGSLAWSILAHAFLRRFRGLRYDWQLLYLHPRGLPRDLSGLPVFYQDLLRTWKLFTATRSVAATEGADLLTEPLLHSPQLRVQVAESRSVRQRLVLAEVTIVGDLLDYDRGDWLDPLTLAQRMGLSRPRTPRCILQE